MKNFVPKHMELDLSCGSESASDDDKIIFNFNKYKLFSNSLLVIVSEFRVNVLSLSSNYIKTGSAMLILMKPLVQSSLKNIDIHNYDVTGCLTILSLCSKCRLIEHIRIWNNVRKWILSDKDKDKVRKAVQNMELKLRNVRTFEYMIWDLR